MKKEIIINSTANENRIAITEDGKLSELFIENEEYERVVGDIYLGRVAKVIPGIKAAFINLGFKQDAFLHFSDVGDQAEDLKALLGDDVMILTMMMMKMKHLRRSSNKSQNRSRRMSLRDLNATRTSSFK